MKKFSFILILALLLSFCGCKNENIFDNGKITVAVTIPPQAEFVKKVCGDTVNLITLLPAGASPETYEPTFKEMQILENADIYFAIGVPIEENTIVPALSSDIKLVNLHKAVSEHYPDLNEGSHRDPHIWLSLKRAIQMVKEIEKTMSELLPENAEKYTKNAKNYIAELETLNSEIKTLFEEKSNKNFIVYHPSFAYFADEYSLSMYALEEHGKEITAKHLSQIIDFAKKENLLTVFYQAENSSKQPTNVAKEIGGKAIKLYPLAENYAENMKIMATEIAKAMK